MTKNIFVLETLQNQINSTEFKKNIESMKDVLFGNEG